MEVPSQQGAYDLLCAADGCLTAANIAQESATTACFGRVPRMQRGALLTTRLFITSSNDINGEQRSGLPETWLKGLGSTKMAIFFFRSWAVFASGSGAATTSAAWAMLLLIGLWLLLRGLFRVCGGR